MQCAGGGDEPVGVPLEQAVGALGDRREQRHRGPFPLEHLDALQDTRPQARIARG
jgi:hypothetical protein